MKEYIVKKAKDHNNMDVIKNVGALDSKYVYIGPSKSHSKWYLPNLKSLKDYREYVVANHNIEELQGKILTCNCDFWKKCHGHVLVYLLMKKNKVEMTIVEFSEDTCPLSNSYPFSFQYQGELFGSVAHAYYWEKSNRDPSLLHDNNLKSVVDKFSKIPPAKRCKLTTHKTVQMLYKMLCKKYQLCSEFKQMVDKNQDNFLLQSTSNKFWGKGYGLSWKMQKNSLKNQTGQNITGWLIMHLNKRNVNYYRKKIIFLCKGEVNLNLMKGLHFVNALV